MMRKKVISARILIGLVVLASTVSAMAYMFGASNNDYSKCYEKGMNHFKKIGEYPKVKSEGMFTTDRVHEMCYLNKKSFSNG